MNADSRDKMQPSLVLSALALSTFMQSSEVEKGSAGRSRALWLRDMAQSSLEQSFNARWVDPTLAQGAWVRLRCSIVAKSRDADNVTAYGLV